MKIEITASEFSALCSAALSDCAARPDDDWRGPLLAQGHLPLYGDIGGAIALAADGTILSQPWDEPLEPASDSWARMALVFASRRHALLARALPSRPPGVKDCEFCRGHGHHFGNPSELCAVCDALGWWAA